MKEIWRKIETPRQAFLAIKRMAVRGAPLIGVVAAFGMAFAAKGKDVEKEARRLKSARPTAINLMWAVDRVYDKAKRGGYEEAIREAEKIMQEEEDRSKNIGKHGEPLFDDGDAVLTHCNAGSLATVEYGTALAPLRIAKEKGKRLKVFATETRPVLQGARLTTYELLKDGFDVTLISDTMVGYIMYLGLVNKVIVGADRVLKDGHVINKIGTYQIAILAKRHKIPFYVALPSSSFDPITGLEEVKIEERDPNEVIYVRRCRIAPESVNVFNPAFDITPPELVSAFITEKGIVNPPFRRGLSTLLSD
jgi:eIF-2B alpha/beta/delta-like uncharacterized protein